MKIPPTENLKSRWDTVNEALAEKEREWQELGLSVNQFNQPDFFMSTKIRAIFKILEEKVGLTDEYLNLIVRETMLEEMIALQPHGEEAIKQVRAAQILEGILPPDAF